MFIKPFSETSIPETPNAFVKSIFLVFPSSKTRVMLFKLKIKVSSVTLPKHSTLASSIVFVISDLTPS